jgi:hypothetical protein
MAILRRLCPAVPELVFHCPDFFQFGLFIGVNRFTGNQGIMLHPNFEKLMAFPATIGTFIDGIGQGKRAISIAFGTLYFI